jgi:holo-[acyl-carrier protein] synthase
MHVGCDIVDIERLSATIDRRPGLAARVFTPRELADARRGGVDAGSPTERARLAARFAAKEATRKALGDLRLPFHATEVRTGDDGAPRLYLHGEPADLDLSISHDAGMAMAFVVGPPTGARLPEARELVAATVTDRATAVGGRVSLEL